MIVNAYQILYTIALIVLAIGCLMAMIRAIKAFHEASLTVENGAVTIND